MHIAPLIHDLAIILAVAALVTILFKKINQPVVLGYLIAGMIVGPHTPPFPLVTDLPNIKTWAELGVIFLMFSLGLEFTFRRLTNVGRAATITALVKVPGMFAAGYFAGQLLGWSATDSFFLGGICCISSTTIILKAFESLNLKTRRFAGLVLGVLIVEDLFAILLLVSFSTLLAGGGELGTELFLSGIKLILIVGSWFIAGYFFIPSFLRYAAKFMDDETLTIFAVALCLILVFVSAQFGYSSALGAFIMGSILAETRTSHRIQELIKPLRDLFAAVFFVSVGMLMDPRVILNQGGTILALTTLVIFGMILNGTLGALLAGQPFKRSVQSGFSLAQIGEFSFILAALGVTLKATSDSVYPIAVAVSVLTTFITPYLIRFSEPVATWLERQLPDRWRALQSQYSTSMTQASDDYVTQGTFKKRFARFLVNAILVSALFLGISLYGIPHFQSYLENQELLQILAWIASVAVSAPFIWGMFTAFRPEKYANGQVSEASTLQQFVGQIFAVTLLGILSDRFFPTSVTLVLTSVWGGTAFFLFYRRLENSYRWFEGKFLSNIGTHQATRPALKSLAPWDLQLSQISVPAESALGGKTLIDAQIRNRFGLNVVVIRRGDQILAPPSAHDQLFPHDELLVLATEDQVEAFQHELSLKKTTQATGELSDYALTRLVIAADSPFVGKTLQNTQIRAELKGLVVGLERGSFRATNPAPDTELKVGDCLWIVGQTH